MLLVSDIHFGKHDQGALEGFLEAATDRSRNPQRLVVLPGDLTQNARPDEYAQASAFLDELLSAGVRIVLTPGNHDFGSLLGEHLPFWGTSPRRRFRDMFRTIQSQSEVLADDDCDTITRVDDDVFVALRSTHRGLIGANRVRRSQIGWATVMMGRLDLSGCRLHFVTHRSLWRDALVDRHLNMVKRRRLEGAFLRPQGFASFIHGHNHRFTCQHTPTPGLGDDILRIGVPTLSRRTRGYVPGWVSWHPGETPQFVSAYLPKGLRASLPTQVLRRT